MRPERTVLYLRVSTDGQTVENQALALREACERRGWQVTAEYRDEGISGTKGADARPGLSAMLADARRGRFDRLAVWSIDRLGRSTALVATTLAELEGLGIGIYADRQGMDTSTVYGKAMISMAAVFAELERGIIVERVHAGLARARKEGKVLGRPRQDATTRRKIVADLDCGLALRTIAAKHGVGLATVDRIKRAREVTGGGVAVGSSVTAPPPVSP